MLLVCKLETFKKCKEVKHIVITIIAITYIFYLMWYFISSWKLLSENPQDTPTPQKNIHSLIFTQSPWNIQKVQVPSFWQHWIFFRPAAERREDTRIDRSVLRKITIDLLHCWDVYDVNLLEKNIDRGAANSCRTNFFM